MSDIFAKNDLYEYSVETLRDERTGCINVQHLQKLLDDYASKGWRLKTTLINELGKNRTSVGYGGISVGTNATVDETILIFERKIRTSSEIEEINRKVKEEEAKRIENEKRLRELEREELNSLSERVNSKMPSDELLIIYRKVPDKKNFFYRLVEDFGEPITIAECRKMFDDEIDLMEIASYFTALQNEGKLSKDEDTKKYTIV